MTSYAYRLPILHFCPSSTTPVRTGTPRSRGKIAHRVAPGRNAVRRVQALGAPKELLWRTGRWRTERADYRHYLLARPRRAAILPEGLHRSRTALRQVGARQKPSQRSVTDTERLRRCTTANLSGYYAGPLHGLRHTYASLLIMAGKHPKYISSQMGHAAAAFSLDVYGHLMERVRVQPVEWIDDLVFPEGWEAALNLHLSGALPSATEGSRVQQSAWWAVQVLNLRPHPCEGCALPLS